MHPNTLLALAAALLLTLLPWTATRQEEGATRPRPRRPSLEERQAALAEQLRGAWQLTSASVAGARVPSQGAAGFLLVQEDYLALEMHLLLPSGYAVSSEQPFFQSGIRRWRFDGEFALQTSALIGCTNATDDERWNFDPPGTRTTLKMILDDEELVLEQPGDSRLVFRKLPKLPFPGDGADALRDARRRREEGRSERR